MSRRPVKRPARRGIFAIHILTASGAAFAFLALVFATGGAFAAMFLALGMALVVDGVDGPLARKFQIAKALPRWSGETLDLVVDFVTYVFVPAYAIAASGLLPSWWALAAGAVIVMSGALYFADREMKTQDNYFRGFPAVWNLAAFYLLLLQPPAAATGATVVVLAALTFSPIRFVHPLRVVHLRPLNIGLMAAWSLLALVAIVKNLVPEAPVTFGALPDRPVFPRRRLAAFASITGALISAELIWYFGAGRRRPGAAEGGGLTWQASNTVAATKFSRSCDGSPQSQASPSRW